MELLSTGRIVLATEPVDWRWGIKSLTTEAMSTLGIEDFVNADVWAVWCNRRHDAVRILHYTADAVILCEQRLRRGSKYPAILAALREGASITITREELRFMLLGRVGPLQFGSGPSRAAPPKHGASTTPAA